MYDAIIVGAGVIGCAIARELSRYQGRYLVLEKLSDIGEGTSKANSGIVHAGYDATPGSLKAKLNVIGNKKMIQIVKELAIPFKQNGSMVVCFHEEEKEQLYKLYEQGMMNGVPELELLSGDKLRELEPMLSDEIIEGLVAKTAGVICPFTLTIALAENAAHNGVTFQCNTEVTNIRKSDEGYEVIAGDHNFHTRTVINAAGVYADRIHNMICEDKIKIQPRKGEYCLFDKDLEPTCSYTIFQLPTRNGKGILVTKTVHGNLLIGPTAADVVDKEEVSTTKEGLHEVLQKGSRSIKGIDTRHIITSFAGLRAHVETGDFIIQESKQNPGFFDAAGIASPGLSCACAIGEMVANMVRDYLGLLYNEEFYPFRKGILHLSDLTLEQREELIRNQPMYGNIICRCEMISEGEIRDSIRRTLGATTLDGIKRRTRAMSGRCQAGFCTSKCVKILADELKQRKEEITKHGVGSELLL